MTTILNADTVTGGAILSGDNSGILQLQASGINGITLNSNGAIGIGNSPNFGTPGQVLSTNGFGSAPTWVTISGVVVTPTLSGPTSVSMLNTVVITITNYNAAFSYNIAVTLGTFSQSGSSINWVIPAVGSNTTAYMYVQAISGGNSSSIATKSLSVISTLIGDTPFVVTNFAVNSLNSGWTI